MWVPSHPDLQSKTPPEKYTAQLGEFLRSVYEDLDTVPPLNKLGMATFYRVCVHRLLKHYLLYLCILCQKRVLDSWNWSYRQLATHCGY